jgi:hypothetical protein
LLAICSPTDETDGVVRDPHSKWIFVGSDNGKSGNIEEAFQSIPIVLVGSSNTWCNVTQ